MRKLATVLILLALVLQVVPAIAVVRSLSVSDFATKRGAFCEIFVEPN